MSLEFKKVRKPILIGLILGLFLAFVIAFAQISLHGKFPEGTKVAGVDISGMTKPEAADLINGEIEQYLETPIKVDLYDGDHPEASAPVSEQELSPGQLGVSFLVDETLSTVREMDGQKISSLKWILKSSVQRTDTPLLVEIDHDLLTKNLEEAFQLKDKAPKNARLYFEGNQLAVEQEVTGQVLDENAMFESLRSVVGTLDQNTPVWLSLKAKTPEVTAERLNSEKDRLSESLDFEITLVDPVYSDDWHIKLRDHLDWVKFSEEQNVNLSTLSFDPAKISIEIDQDKLNQFVDEEISRWLDVPVENVNIYKDENGQILIEGHGNNGKQIQRKHLKKAIELAVANKVREVPIPVIDVEPQITVSPELQELGIKDRLSIGHTSYYGSPANRVHNIMVGSSKFNGLLVAPGERFSFNQNLGPVDGANGYRKELVIKQEGTIPEYGGGICQVSTTFYRAILLGGLPVNNRREHSYAVSYYSQVLGHGLDATIYLGGQDLEFTNDTGHHILIQTYTQNDYELYVVFYGTADGRHVELDGPYLSNYHNPGPAVYTESDSVGPGETKQVEKAHTGFSALWYRYLTDANGETTVETITSNYKAIPAKYVVGAGSPDSSIGAAN